MDALQATASGDKATFCRTCGFHHEPGDCPRWPSTSETATKALEDAGTMDTALVALSDMIEQATYDLDRAEGVFHQVHDKADGPIQDAAISAHLAFLRATLDQAAVYIADVQARTGQEH